MKKTVNLFYGIKLKHNQGGRLNLIGLFMVLLTALALAGCSASPTNTTQSTSSHTGHSAAVTPAERIPAFVENLEAAKPLPKVLDPSQFANPVVAQAYLYAQQNPEVFAQQPCYCFCDLGHGHRSLLDCYATDHSAT